MAAHTELEGLISGGDGHHRIFLSCLQPDVRDATFAKAVEVLKFRKTVNVTTEELDLIKPTNVTTKMLLDVYDGFELKIRLHLANFAENKTFGTSLNVLNREDFLLGVPIKRPARPPPPEGEGQNARDYVQEAQRQAGKI